LRKIDLITGATVVGPIDTGLPGFDAIAVYGEPRAALTPSTIPALSTTLLGLLLVAIIAIACTHLRSMP
jgi:biopolymer transport protein ExbB/TolQ